MRAAPVRVAARSAAALAALVLPAGQAVAASAPLVATARSSRLHVTTLVDRAGRTLDHLSVERPRRFICTNAACLSFWRPLVVAKGVRPTGRVPLGALRRPDGRPRVAHRGESLYTFAGEAKRGDVKGEGFKDIGVWHAATVGAGASTPAPAPAAGGYGSGR